MIWIRLIFLYHLAKLITHNIILHHMSPHWVMTMCLEKYMLIAIVIIPITNRIVIIRIAEVLLILVVMIFRYVTNIWENSIGMGMWAKKLKIGWKSISLWTKKLQVFCHKGKNCVYTQNCVTSQNRINPVQTWSLKKNVIWNTI